MQIVSNIRVYYMNYVLLIDNNVAIMYNYLYEVRHLKEDNK